MWTLAELASNCKPLSGHVWRGVESIAKNSTLKLVDSGEEQAILEEILDRTKPAFPTEAAGLHFLLSTPFRYAPYPKASRFRAENSYPGVFYGSETDETAIAETIFYRFLFFTESPGMTLPASSVEHSLFKVKFSAERALDLTASPFDRLSEIWEHPNDYRLCNQLASDARKIGAQAIRYKSIRCPEGGANVAILTPQIFAEAEPNLFTTWHLFAWPDAMQASCEWPKKRLQFSRSQFSFDPRIAQAG